MSRGEDLEGYASVRRWISSVDGLYHLTSQEWRMRLSVLEEFCSSLGEDPDRVISASRADREAKLEYMRKLRRLTVERYPEPRTAHDAENVVRSFLIHNGARVLTRPFEHPISPTPTPAEGRERLGEAVTRGMARGTRPRLD